VDYTDHTSDQLSDALIDTLARWDKYERYYLDTLVPRIMSGQDLRGSAVDVIAHELRDHRGTLEVARVRGAWLMRSRGSWDFATVAV